MTAATTTVAAAELEARRGPGRPPAEIKRTPYQLRLSDDEKSKLAALGGPEWIREQIRAARRPRGSKAAK